MSDTYKILLAEDEETLAAGLVFNLGEEGYSVVLAADGRKALDEFNSGVFDLIILDIMLPFLSGFEVAKAIREKDPRIPVLMLTARGDISDRMQGLKLGADDYMLKPFHLEELLLRIRGMLKRKSWYSDFSGTPEVYRFGSNEVDFANLKCKTGEGEITLTSQEATLLKFMIENRDKMLSRREILEKVWCVSSSAETRTIDNFIVRFRKYFENDPANPVFFKSIRGIGYIFETPDQKG